MNEIICPLCNHTLANGETCTQCGYDRSCDYEQYPTLFQNASSTVTRAKRRTQYEQAQENHAEAKRQLAQQESKIKELQNICDQQNAEIEALKARVSQLLEEQRQYEEVIHKLFSQNMSLRDEEIYQAGETAYANGDYTEAVNWYRIAAIRGHAGAQCRLGYCYDYGYGATIDHAEAVKWYRKAAEQGEPFAQYELGCCYKSGIGVRQNATEAIKWFRKAAEQGNESAQQALARLNQQ